MELDEAVRIRRSYRAMEDIEITDQMVTELLSAAHLAPSCFNNQSWRFIAIREKEQLERVFETLTRGNYWMKKSSMVIAVFTEPGSDCEVQGVRYEEFDTGMATGFLLLKATDMGLLTHCISGFNKAEVKEVLGIPDNFTMITLIAVGKKSSDLSYLGEKHQDQERSPRDRRPLEEVAYMDHYPSP
ncbi:MAG: nitroreductase family protein [Thermoplasmatota archaeon]